MLCQTESGIYMTKPPHAPSPHKPKFKVYPEAKLNVHVCRKTYGRLLILCLYNIYIFPTCYFYSVIALHRLTLIKYN